MSNELNYEILIKGTGKAVYNDINYCAFIRCPMSKNATITRIRMSMDQIDIRELMDACSSHQFPPIDIKIYASGRETKERTKLIYQTKYMCLNVIPDRPLDYKDIQMFTTLELCHPILHTLGTDNAFNVIENNITAYDVLKKFEKHLSDTHQIFDKKKSFNHIGTDKDKNEHLYEQILVKTKSDLDVPSYLLNTYKTHNTLCSYFFDSFHITDKNKQELICHYMNLNDKEHFQKQDIKEFGDSSFLTKLIWERPFTDVHNVLNKNQPVFNMGHKEIAFDEKKDPQSKVAKKSQPTNEQVKLFQQGSRQIYSIESKESVQAQEKSRQTTSVRIVTPDKMEAAKKRFEKNQEIFNKKVASSVMFEITNGMPDFPQFGKRYNLDLTDKDSYTFVPLNIVNLFMRQQSQREPYLKLNNKVLTLKYNPD